MAKQNRTVLKTYFESGDIPNQSQYSDLIDSNLNLSENNTGNINLTGDITASGNISASGTIFADNFQSTGGDVAGISFTDDLNLTGNITASGNISASGTINTQTLKVNDLTDGRVTLSSTNGRLADDSDLTFSNQTLTVTKIANIDTTHITASGNISASGDIITPKLNVIAVGSPTADGYYINNGQIISGSVAGTLEFGDFDSDGTRIKITDTSNTIELSTDNPNAVRVSVDGQIISTGNVSSSGTITGQNIILGSGGFISAKDTSGNDELILFNNTDSFLGFGDTDQELRIQGNPVRIISSFTSSQDALFENDVTFEQNITASGDIIASDLILTSPNGSKFKITVNNSGHLSLTGSAV